MTNSQRQRGSKKIGEFLTSEHAFDQTWARNEKAVV